MTSLKAEFCQQIYLYKRYLYSYISDLFLVILMFMAIFWGGTLVGNGVVGTSLNASVVGYVLWTLIQSTISQMGMVVSNEAQNGILEQQYLMPISEKRLYFNKSIVNIAVSIIQACLALVIIMSLTNHWIIFPAVVLLPFSLALAVTVGLGYLIVSLVLRFKRIGSTLVIFQYIYLAILLINFEKYSLVTKYFFCFLPICPMVGWIRLAVNHQNYNSEFYLMGSIFNAILWITIGLVVFKFTDKYVKKKGTLALY